MHVYNYKDNQLSNKLNPEIQYFIQIYSLFLGKRHPSDNKLSSANIFMELAKDFSPQIMEYPVNKSYNFGKEKT